jgi:hypothetical protein
MQLFWLEAINNELESIMSNHTWELVELSHKTKPIGCKWMFKKKLKANDIIDKYKACLVVKGYKQRCHVDYFDTNSLVSRIYLLEYCLPFTTKNLFFSHMQLATCMRVIHVVNC